MTAMTLGTADPFTVRMQTPSSDMRELTDLEIDCVAGGPNDGQVAGGVATAGAATLAISLAAASGPVGWVALGAYAVTMFAAGYMIGDGLTDTE